MNTINYDLIIKNASVVLPEGVQQCDMGIRAGTIAELGSIATHQAQEVIDAKNLHLLPGVIDTQVHFREPGFEHKETIETGSRAAVAGGVTAFLEMPNTKPLTINSATHAYKVQRGIETSYCDFGFFVGGTPSEVEAWGELESLYGCPGIKVFMGSSTGDLLLQEDAGILDILKKTRRRPAFHAEDEAILQSRKHLVETSKNVQDHPLWRSPEQCLNATTRLINLAQQAGRVVHVLHISTKQEIAFLQHNKRWASLEVTPQHLTLDARLYQSLGTRLQMNPPIRDTSHQDALWWAIANGVVDVIGSDHAPHTLEEKSLPYPSSPSGMPGVETSLAVMLTHVKNGKLSLLKLVKLMSENPANLYNIAKKGKIAVGYDADLCLVDLQAEYTMLDSLTFCKSGWTPYHGMKFTGKVLQTFVRGQRVFQEGVFNKIQARPLEFYY